MKPLTLTIHPKLEDTNLSATEIHQGRWTERCLSAAKRLTDAELAAEHWSWQGNLQWWLRPESAVYPNHRQVVARVKHRAEVMERFATLPHFDA